MQLFRLLLQQGQGTMAMPCRNPLCTAKPREPVATLLQSGFLLEPSRQAFQVERPRQLTTSIYPSSRFASRMLFVARLSSPVSFLVRRLFALNPWFDGLMGRLVASWDTVTSPCVTQGKSPILEEILLLHVAYPLQGISSLSRLSRCCNCTVVQSGEL